MSKNIRRQFTNSWLIIGAFASITGVASTAKADPCDPLVSDLRAWLDADPRNTVEFKWATNYQAHDHWTVNYGYGMLTKGQPFASHNPLLSGTATRLFSEAQYCPDPVSGGFGCRTPDQPFDAKRSENVLIDIFSDGGVMTARQFGPNPGSVCYGTKFLTLNYGDGFDSFSFSKYSGPR
jgi:hypothetical protein